MVTELLEWAAARELEWDATETADGTRWGCRIEIYTTNPTEIPDWSAFQTEIAAA